MLLLWLNHNVLHALPCVLIGLQSHMRHRNKCSVYGQDLCSVVLLNIAVKNDHSLATLNGTFVLLLHKSWVSHQTTSHGKNFQSQNLYHKKVAFKCDPKQMFCNLAMLQKLYYYYYKLYYKLLLFCICNNKAHRNQNLIIFFLSLFYDLHAAE